MPGPLRPSTHSGALSLSKGAEPGLRMTSLRHSAESLVDGDDAGVDAGFGLRDRVLRLQLGALRVEQRQKVSDALAIAGTGNRRRAPALARLIGKLHEARLLLAIGDQRVFRLLDRAEHRLLITGQRLPGCRLHAAQARTGAS